MRKYNRIFFIVSAMLSGLIITANLIIDPFDLFGIVSIERFNELKPSEVKQVRMVKAHKIRQTGPKGIILGSSRTDFGLDPAHPGWSASSRPVFNAALVSGRISEALAYLKHANAQQPIEQAVVGLDYFMFDANHQFEVNYSENRLSSAAKGKLQIGWLYDLFVSLFSMHAVKASIDTVALQSEWTGVSYLDNGARHPEKNWEKIVQVGGHRAAFVSNEQYNLSAPDGVKTMQLAKDNDSYPGFEALQEIIRFCSQQNIELHLVISPIHAWKSEIFWQLGYWEKLESWKRKLVSIIEFERDFDGNIVPLWDFSGYNSITTESVPLEIQPDKRMHYYWESSHYRKEVGDMMLDKVFNIANPRGPIDFGVQLKQESLEQHLESIRHQRELYAMHDPLDIKLIASLIEQSEDKKD